MKISLGIVDDHHLFLKSLSMLLESFADCQVLVQATGAKELMEKMKLLKKLPDIMLIDVNMPDIDGIDTALWLRKEYPEIKLVALSSSNEEKTILKMMSAGCCAYFLKDTHPNDLEKALHEIALSSFQVQSLIPFSENLLD